jgi:hypothetical protein
MIRMGRLFRRRAVLSALLLLGTMPTVGCGSVPDETAIGIVTLNGVRVTAGTVVFTDTATGATSSGTIQPDGSYTVNGLSQSSYYVSVLNPQAPQPGPIPAAYGTLPNAIPIFIILDANGDAVQDDIALTSP